jgi:hypothetical protein
MWGPIDLHLTKGYGPRRTRALQRCGGMDLQNSVWLRSQTRVNLSMYI